MFSIVIIGRVVVTGDCHRHVDRVDLQETVLIHNERHRVEVAVVVAELSGSEMHAVYTGIGLRQQTVACEVKVGARIQRCAECRLITVHLMFLTVIVHRGLVTCNVHRRIDLVDDQITVGSDNEVHRTDVVRSRPLILELSRGKVHIDRIRIRQAQRAVAIELEVGGCIEFIADIHIVASDMVFLTIEVNSEVMTGDGHGDLCRGDRQRTVVQHLVVLAAHVIRAAQHHHIAQDVGNHAGIRNGTGNGSFHLVVVGQLDLRTGGGVSSNNIVTELHREGRILVFCIVVLPFVAVCGHCKGFRNRLDIKVFNRLTHYQSVVRHTGHHHNGEAIAVRQIVNHIFADRKDKVLTIHHSIVLGSITLDGEIDRTIILIMVTTRINAVDSDDQHAIGGNTHGG